MRYFLLILPSVAIAIFGFDRAGHYHAGTLAHALYAAAGGAASVIAVAVFVISFAIALEKGEL